MARWTFKYHEEDYGVIGFDASTMEEASYLFNQVRDGEIEYDELPNYSRSTKGGEITQSDLLLTITPLPTIPMFRTVE